jgi:hypothetical protein
MKCKYLQSLLLQSNINPSAKVEKQYHVPHYQSNGTPWWKWRLINFQK